MYFPGMSIPAVRILTLLRRLAPSWSRTTDPGHGPIRLTENSFTVTPKSFIPQKRLSTCGVNGTKKSFIAERYGSRHRTVCCLCRIPDPWFLSEKTCFLFGDPVIS